MYRRVQHAALARMRRLHTHTQNAHTHTQALDLFRKRTGSQQRFAVRLDKLVPRARRRRQVIGEAAFGVKFDVQEKDAAGRITENRIVEAAKYVLENTAAGERGLA